MSRPFELGPATCVRETERGGLLVRLDSDSPAAVDAPDPEDPEVWIPRKALHPDSEVRELGDQGELYVKASLANARGW